jgi:hypothetical protein
VVYTRLLTIPVRIAAILWAAPAAPTQARNDQRADPLPRSITLEIPRSLLAILRDLATGIDGEAHALGGLLDALIRDLETSVPSYRGLRLTISQNGFPIVLTAFGQDGHDGHDWKDGHDGHDGGGEATSLQVPLALLDSGFAPDSQIVFYAGTPGAFVDLAADLHFALSGSTPESTENADLPTIQIDADPSPRTQDFSLSGLTELSTIDRAVGVMIVKGHHPDHAHATLRRDAARAGLEPHIWAAQLLSLILLNRTE